TVARDEVGARLRDERCLEAVERAVDVRDDIAPALEVEGRSVDLAGAEADLAAALVGGTRLREQGVHLVGGIALAEPVLQAEHAAHALSSAASCPHAPSMSLPRVSRIVVGTPCPRRRATNSSSTRGSDAVHLDPGV